MTLKILVGDVNAFLKINQVTFSNFVAVKTA